MTNYQQNHIKNRDPPPYYQSLNKTTIFLNLVHFYVHEVIVAYYKLKTSNKIKQGSPPASTQQTLQTTIPFGMRVSTKLYKQIEDNRGQVNRNRFLITLLEEHFNQKNNGVLNK